MVADKIENLGSYPQLEKYQKETEESIKAPDMQELEEGRYVLREDILIAPIQKCHTRDKDSSCMESRKKYANLQYIHKGEEMIYTDRMEELMPAEGRTPEEDILFYKPRKGSGADALENGMLGCYEPRDAHIPCITYLNSCDVVEVVFKIKMI